MATTDPLGRITVDCGHLSWRHTEYNADGQRVCHDCWMAHQEATGKVEVGCSYPNVLGCPERRMADPELERWDEKRHGRLTPSNPRWRRALLACTCYLGHDACDAKRVRIDLHIKGMIQQRPLILAVYEEWDNAGRPADWSKPPIKCVNCGHEHAQYSCAWTVNKHTHYRCPNCQLSWME